MSLQELKGSPADVHAPAANVAAIVAYAADVNDVHCISGVTFSYDGTPTGGNLKIEDGVDVIYEVDITNAGPGPIEFKPPKSGTVNQAMTITLAAGGVGVSGKVSVHGHYLRRGA